MIKQQLLDELERLQKTNEQIEERTLYVESLRKLIQELDANSKQLDEDFVIRQNQEHLNAQKNEDESESLILYVYKTDNSSVLNSRMIYFSKTRSKRKL